MLRIGLSGNIGSGKSFIASIFKSMHIPVFDADNEAKKLYETNKDLKQKIIENFGEAIYPNDRFDKESLAKIVFHDKEKLKILNTLVHPLVLEQSENWFSNQSGIYAIKEAALLIESTSYLHLDKLILVICNPATALQRAMKRDATNAESIKRRMENQMPQEEKIPLADFIIDNNEGVELIPQIVKIHNQILELV